MAKEKSDLKSFEEELNKLEDALQILSDDLKLIQKGSKGQPYWNGSNACTSLKASLANLDHNKVLYKNLKKCYNYIKKLAITKKNS